MTLQRDPPRLLDPGSPTDAGLRNVLQSVHAALPSAAQLAALGRKLDVATAAPPSASARSHFAATGAFKVSVGLLAVGASAWFVWNARRPHEVQPAHEVRSRVAEPAARARLAHIDSTRARAQVASPEPATLDSAPAPAQAAPHIVNGGKPPSVHAAPPIKHATLPRAATRAAPARTDTRSQTGRVAAQAPTVAPASTAVTSQAVPPELTLLSRAQRLLAQDPRAALEVTDEHARSYPGGAFAEEREALAIDALRRLGRRQELQARARAFLQRYPTSPHRERIEAWLL
jgi:hypothetical protein